MGLVLLGLILGSLLPKVVPAYLGKFLFWIGVPISNVAFLRQADLSRAIWAAPIVAWIAILLGAGLAWAWINWQTYLKDDAAQGNNYVTSSVPSSWTQQLKAVLF